MNYEDLCKKYVLLGCSDTYAGCLARDDMALQSVIKPVQVETQEVVASRAKGIVKKALSNGNG